MSSNDLRDRARGCLLGLAIGDAVGTTVEFEAPGTFPPVSDMTGGGPFGLPAGAWTDDTSMALCLADSLVETGGFDPADQLERYVRWYRHGERSAIGRCFDIGNSTRDAITRFERTREPYAGDAFPRAAGNGTLMRLAPIPIACAGDLARAADWGARSARTTHGAPQAVDATRWYAQVLVAALAGVEREALLGPGGVAEALAIGDAAPSGPARGSAAVDVVASDAGGGGAVHPEIAAVQAGSYREKQPPEIRGRGYVVPALEAALWAVWSTTTYADAVLAAVNLGDDADTTAAIAGQLAGALYGACGIPTVWRERVLLGDEIQGLADALLLLAPAAVGSAPEATESFDGSPAPPAEVGPQDDPPGRERPAPPGSAARAMQPHLPPASAPEPVPGAARRWLPDDPRRPDAPPGESWWVEEPRLLAGPYPGHATRERAEQKLEAFLDAGITLFVDLTEHGEGPPLHPYEPLLRRIARQRSRAARAAGREAPRIGYVRLPVEDMTAPPAWQLHATLRVIEEALAADEHVYVHCWGGVGRTGTVIAARLVEQGRDGGRAIEDLAALRRRAPRAGRPSPEAQSQRALVANWRQLSSAALRPQDVPAADAPHEEIVEFAHRFDGYRVLGGPTGNPADRHVTGPVNAARAAFGADGTIPQHLGVDELRAVLFLHVRGQRFGADEEVDRVPSEDGSAIVARNPAAPEADVARRFQRAIVRRIHGLLAERDAHG